MRTMRNRILALVAGAMMAAGGLPAADRASAPVSVSANVVPGCRLSSTILEFGEYDPLGPHAIAPLDATTSIEVTCSPGVSAVLRLDASGALALRHAEGFLLAYGLYEDAARAEPFTSMALSGDLRLLQVPVYGRVGPGQVVPSGSYAHSVTFQVDF